jgi:hypothetical protein
VPNHVLPVPLELYHVLLLVLQLVIQLMDINHHQLVELVSHVHKEPELVPQLELLKIVIQDSSKLLLLQLVFHVELEPMSVSQKL